MAKAGTVLLSKEDVARAAYQVGFRDDKLIIAVAVSQAESSFWRDSISASNDYGLWQINRPAHPTYFGDDGARLLADPVYNAQAAWDISGRGTNWNPWYTYTPLGKPSGTGPYRNYLNNAVAAVSAVLGTTVHLPIVPVSGPVNPADPQAQTPGNNQPVVRIDQNEMQADFHDNHRRLGTRSALMDIFAGPTYTGVMYPVLPNDSQGKTPSFGSQSGVRGESPAGIPGWNQAVKFLFNPNEISFDYSANPNVLPQGALNPSQTNPDLPLPDSNTIIQFDLFFDRTYEVMLNTVPIGVLTDIRALEHLCGISDATPVMLQNPVAIHFGGPVQFHFKALLRGFSVKYQHFSHGMVPMRAVVSVTATRLSNVDPWASPEDVQKYSGDDWRDKIVNNAKGEGNPWEAAATGGTTSPPSSSANPNNPWVKAVGGP